MEILLYKVGFAALAAVGVGLFLRARQHKQPKVQGSPLRVKGMVMQAFLDPNIPRQCAKDHGKCFGAGLHLKTSPQSTHPAAQCRCQENLFSLSAQQVFRGGLNAPVDPWGYPPELTHQTAGWLMQLLHSWGCEQDAGTRAAWLKEALSRPKFAKTKPRKGEEAAAIDRFLERWQGAA